MKMTVCSFLVALVVTGAPGVAGAQVGPHTLHGLKKLNECELTRLFEEACTPDAVPIGHARGLVLLMTDAKLPRVRARLASTVWKGKHFADDGEFINQWPGFQALRGKAYLGESWYDGKPCLALDYPPDTPLMGHTRDELRQIGPGLFLGRLYETGPCPRFRGYIAIQIECR